MLNTNRAVSPTWRRQAVTASPVCVFVKLLQVADLLLITWQLLFFIAHE